MYMIIYIQQDRSYIVKEKNMKGLSKTQIKCIEGMKHDIDIARESESFEEWLIKYSNYDLEKRKEEVRRRVFGND